MDKFRKRTRWQGVKKKSIRYRVIYPTMERRKSLVSILDMLTSSAIIGIAVKWAGYSRITDLEAVGLVIISVMLLVFSYLLKME